MPQPKKPEEKAPAGEGQWAKFGAPVDGKTVVPAETLLSDPKAYVGQNIVVSGRVADVCSKAGCWMVIAEGDSTMHIRMKDHAFSVAKDGAGSDCRVQGEVVEIQVDPDTVAHFASESRKPELMPENSGKPVVYEMVASGVEFKAAAVCDRRGSADGSRDARVRLRRAWARHPSVCLGPFQGPHCCLLPWMARPGAAWDAVAGRLAARGFRVLAPDHRGHGHSAWTPTYHFMEYVADLEAVLDEAQVASTILVGHSMGGTIASLYAGLRLDLTGLVLLDGLGPGAVERRHAVDQAGVFLDQCHAPRPHKPMASMADAAERIRRTNRACHSGRTSPGKTRNAGVQAGLVWRWDPLHRTRAAVAYTKLGISRRSVESRRRWPSVSDVTAGIPTCRGWKLVFKHFSGGLRTSASRGTTFIMRFPTRSWSGSRRFRGHPLPSVVRLVADPVSRCHPGLPQARIHRV